MSYGIGLGVVIVVHQRDDVGLRKGIVPLAGPAAHQPDAELLLDNVRRISEEPVMEVPDLERLHLYGEPRPRRLVVALHVHADAVSFREFILVFLRSVLDGRNVPLRDQFPEKEDHQVGESLIAEELLEYGVGDDVGVFLEEDHLMDLPPAERVRIAKLRHN